MTGPRTPPGADPATVARLTAAARVYLDAVEAAGGEPVFVTAGDPMPERYDGVLLTGGVDLHPRHYGERIEETVRTAMTIDETRDAMELPLARAALEADLPTLGICRGIQTLNVAAGGTLWQDLSLAGVDPKAHNQEGRCEAWEYGHEITVEPATRLAAIMGEGAIGVNTYHHQAVRDPAPGFHISARSSDGVIEGLESLRHRFVLGVQWHPERLVSHHPVHRELFRRFVEAARRS